MDLINNKEMSCISCLKGKITVQPFNESESKSKALLEIIHTDVCGPFNTNSIGGSQYFLTFVDDYSRYVYVYFIKNKSEVFNKFEMFKNFVECQTGNKIKILRSDNGKEYVNNEFDNFLSKCGIKHELTVPYTPQQNGVAERYNRTVVEMARSMLIHSGLEEKFWGEAVGCATYIKNRTSSRALINTTPYEIWNGKKPNVKYFKIFGCLAVGLMKSHQNKFQAKGKVFIMMGYSNDTKGYRLYDPDKKIIVIKRDVKFEENKFLYTDQAETYINTLKTNNEIEFKIKQTKENDNSKDMFYECITDMPIHENNKEKEYETVEIDHINKRIESNHEYESSTLNEITREEDDEETEEENDKVTEGETNEESEEPKNASIQRRGRGRPQIIRTGTIGRPRKQYNMINMANHKDVFIPETAEIALKSKYAKEWNTAMEKEYEALIDNKTWELADLPKGQKSVGTKWVYALKRDKLGNIERFKARLVAKGFSQVYGINYTETFSPVVRYETIRMIFAIAAEYKLHLHQMDVSTAYLNSDLNEDVYIKQPEYYENKEFPNKVLKLKKALYGLKQSGRQWNIKLDNILKKLGFKQCKSEPCVYINNSKGKINILAIYVDDILIASTNKEDLNEIKNNIGKEFKVVDKGPAEHFLSFEIERDGETGPITISQTLHINKILKEFKMEDSTPISSPLDPNHQVICNNEHCKQVDQKLYQSLIGSLMYIALCTRPDILHTVCKLSQRNNNPHNEHLMAAKRVLRYLNGTKNKKLRYYKTGRPISCYVDADWGSDATDRRSYTGYTVFLGGCVFSYESKKQSTVALSSTEAEYMALAAATKEIIHINNLLIEMQLDCAKNITIYGDNMGAINIAKNPVQHARSKHIDIKYHFIRETFKNKDFNLIHCNTENMVADIMTKNLSKCTHEKFRNLMGLI